MPSLSQNNCANTELPLILYPIKIIKDLLAWRPVVKTPCFQCKQHRFDPWSGNQDPACCVIYIYIYFFFLMKERDASSIRADIIVMNDKVFETIKLE